MKESGRGKERKKKGREGKREGGKNKEKEGERWIMKQNREEKGENERDKTIF